MKNKKIVSLLLTGAMTAALLAVPAQAADPPSAVRVSSYKGNTLEVGEISGLIIGPSGTEYTANSSTPDVVRVGNVLGRWTATAQAPGTATITVTAPDGGTGSATITVVSADAAVPDKADDSAAYLEVRQELIRLINQTRVANGVSELPVSDALMTAAQAGYIRVFLKTAGADSPRPVKLRQKGSLWYLWEYSSILSGIRIPAERDPWG